MRQNRLLAFRLGLRLRRTLEIQSQDCSLVRLDPGSSGRWQRERDRARRDQTAA